MKANELRIGNWVEHDNEFSYRNNPETSKIPYYFQWDAHDWYQISECGISLENIKPIPLTHEILVKNKFNIGGPECVGIVYEMLEYPGYWEYKGAKIKYVHQLQNLYFALAGEELQIEL